MTQIRALEALVDARNGASGGCQKWGGVWWMPGTGLLCPPWQSLLPRFCAHVLFKIFFFFISNNWIQKVLLCILSLCIWLESYWKQTLNSCSFSLSYWELVQESPGASSEVWCVVQNGDALSSLACQFISGSFPREWSPTDTESKKQRGVGLQVYGDVM